LILVPKRTESYFFTGLKFDFFFPFSFKKKYFCQAFSKKKKNRKKEKKVSSRLPVDMKGLVDSGAA